MREHWLPGYAVVCPSEPCAQAWRRHLPPDRSVYRIGADGRPVQAGNNAPAEWPALVAALAAEARPAASRLLPSPETLSP